MLIHIALLLTLIETLALSAVLMNWARQVQGARLLVIFLLGVAAWIVGNELPNWAGIETAPVAMLLLSSLPLTSAAFAFLCDFCEVAIRPGWMRLAYAMAGWPRSSPWLGGPGSSSISRLLRGGMGGAQYPWLDQQHCLGHAGCGRHAGAGSRVVACVFAAAAANCGGCRVLRLGLDGHVGLSFAALDIPVYPWQVLAAPGYPVILVYGILRYRVFVANVWARRALASALLILLCVMVVPLTVLLPMDSRWLNAVVVAATCVALSGPVWRIAAKLVYPAVFHRLPICASGAVS